MNKIFKAIDEKFVAMDKKIDDGFNEMKIYIANMQNNLSESLVATLIQTISNNNNILFKMMAAK